ncbi:MAG: T9SS type A sorting domain-containing protein [Bacteroidales bacterium]|nr:T9SS type A sorting domain-containing protein [Bacteroidales bacterium]
MAHRTLFISVAINWIFLCGYSQISQPIGNLVFEDTLSMNPVHEWVSIPSPNENLWQVGYPNKQLFDSTLSGGPILVTDTIESYPTNADNYLLVSIPSVDSLWGVGIFSFYHRYNTDTLSDGGFIEISYDRGQTWINLIRDNNHVQVNFIGLYSEIDTISGNIPAFSGTSNDWSYVELYWVWIALTKKSDEQWANTILKFRFKSDSIDSEGDGWMIDQIVFRAYSVPGSIEDYSKPAIHIFPNPVSDVLNIYFPPGQKCNTMKIYGTNGTLVSSEIIDESNSVNLSYLPEGLYWYILFDDSVKLSSGKLFKY